MNKKQINKGDKVWVYQSDGFNTDGWVEGILIKKTKKRFLVKNLLRNIIQYYKYIEHIDTPNEELKDYGYWKRVKNVRYPSREYSGSTQIKNKQTKERVIK